MSIKVIVAGFKGRMGSTAVEMVKGDDELTFLSSRIKLIWLALMQMFG